MEYILYNGSKESKHATSINKLHTSTHKDFKDPRKTHFGQNTKWIQEGIKVWPNKFVVQIISKKQITKDLFNKVQQMN